MVGEGTVVISITCNKKSDTMMHVSKILESLNLKIISASVTSIRGSLLHTLFVEVFIGVHMLGSFLFFFFFFMQNDYSVITR